MDTRHKYLGGDIYFLENVNKIAPRRMELPLFMQTTSEPKQVIRALRQRPVVRSSLKKPLKITKIDRSLADSSSEWKLPPNVYHLGDFTTQRKQMGRRGPYQCFTVERDEKTVRNHFAPKPDTERCETDYYELPSTLDDGKKQSNAYKNKFLKADRFSELKIDGTPPPTKYYPQNFVIKPSKSSTSGKSKSKSKVIEVDPVFYYPYTTVPEKEMKFNKPLITPEPGRYNTHHLTCGCYIKRSDRNIFTGKKVHRDEGQNLNKIVVDEKKEAGEEHGEEEEDAEEEEEAVKIEDDEEKQLRKKKAVDDMSVTKRGVTANRLGREPISFRLKRSTSYEDLSVETAREIRFNTMIKKRNLFSTKTGRPIGFLSAAPRFGDTIEKPIKLHEKEKKKILQTDEKSATDSTPKTRRMTEKRLKELATPKHAQVPKYAETKIQVFTKLPPPSFKNFAEKFRVVHKVSTFSIFGLKKLREKSLQQKEEWPVQEEDIVDDSQLSQIVISK